MSGFENAPSKKQRDENIPVPVQDWTQLDHATHDFVNSESYRRYCLNRFGQYMGSNGVRVVKNGPL